MLHGAMGWKKAGKSWPRKKLKWVVKHSKAEFTRKRPGKLSAGTQQLDRQWEHAKGAVPKQRITKRLGKIKEELWAYLYQGYWRQQVSGSLFHKLGQLCAETRWSPKKKKGVLQLAQWNLMTLAVFSTERSHCLTALQGILTVMYLRNFIDVLETPTRVANSNEMFENGSFHRWQHTSAPTGDVTYVCPLVVIVLKCWGEKRFFVGFDDLCYRVSGENSSNMFT